MSFIISLLAIGPMSHVDFNKCPCQRVKFRGQGPSTRAPFGLAPTGGGECHPVSFYHCATLAIRVETHPSMIRPVLPPPLYTLRVMTILSGCRFTCYLSLLVNLSFCRWSPTVSERGFPLPVLADWCTHTPM